MTAREIKQELSSQKTEWQASSPNTLTPRWSILTSRLWSGLQLVAVETILWNRNAVHACWLVCYGLVIRLLLEKGLSTLVDINQMLLTACEEANIELVTLLLSSGANANFLDNDGSRPVHPAAHNSQINPPEVRRKGR
jgi:hypothetical protein